MNAIVARSLGKGYRQYARPSDSLKELILRRPFHTTLWALQDLSLELPKGGTLGVIGDNGAGKSTLLKLFAGTQRASRGELDVRGRVSAILELGSGFHPEFTGLENIRIGCAMLGLGAREIEQRIPGIIEFSELGEAVQRPVKTYSSGMYVRLAFSVVTSVEPDILVVDEALSVGDQHFQKKSLDRIRGFIEQGRTLVFCSHNLYQVKSLCQQVAWLHQGRLRRLGSPEEVVEQYLDYTRERDRGESAPQRAAPGPVADTDAAITAVELNGHDGGFGFVTGDDLEVDIRVQSPRLGVADLSLAVVLMRNDDLHVYGTSTEIEGVRLHHDGGDRYGIRYRIPDLPLLSGRYTLYIYLLDEQGIHIYDMRESILPFTVRHDSREQGVARLPHEWDAG